MSDLLVKAGDDTARMDNHEVVAYLLRRLGPTLTAYIAGSKSRAMPARWAAPPGDSAHAEPSDDKARRLKAAHTVFLLIEDAENDQVARSWLISANPRLDGVTPVELLRDDKAPVVFRAADAFITDTYYA
jgi:predicted FMN-binding regulatory protein PaiB